MSLNCLTITQTNRAPFDRFGVSLLQADLIALNAPWIDLALTVPEALSVCLLEDALPFCSAAGLVPTGRHFKGEIKQIKTFERAADA